MNKNVKCIIDVPPICEEQTTHRQISIAEFFIPQMKSTYFWWVRDTMTLWSVEWILVLEVCIRDLTEPVVPLSTKDWGVKWIG